MLKPATFCLLLLSFTCVCPASNDPKETTKVSKGSLDVESEVKAFYTKLTSSDAEVRKEVQALTAEAQENNGGIYHVYEPHVVEWFPTESSWDVGRGTSSMSGHFLVIQNVGYGRGKHAGYETALLAEFEAVQESISTKLDPEHESRLPKVLSTKLTLRFLGFRNAKLAPLQKP